MEGLKFILQRAKLFVSEVVSWIELCCSFLGAADVLVPNKVEIYGVFCSFCMAFVSIKTTLHFSANGISGHNPETGSNTLWLVRNEIGLLNCNSKWRQNCYYTRLCLESALLKHKKSSQCTSSSVLKTGKKTKMFITKHLYPFKSACVIVGH